MAFEVRLSWPIRSFSPIDSPALEVPTAVATITKEQRSFLLEFSKKFSSYKKLIRSGVYVLRFIKRLPSTRIISLSVIVFRTLYSKNPSANLLWRRNYIIAEGKSLPICYPEI